MDLKRLIYKQALHLKRVSHKRIESPYLYHASEAGDCKRTIYLKRVGKIPEREPATVEKQAELQMLFNDGRFHQRAITEYLFQAPGVHITNIEDDRIIPVTLENGQLIIISGHPDGIAYDPKPRERWVVEVKGINHFSCQKLVDDDIETLKIAYPKAIPQTRMYCKMYDTVGGIVLIKNKNTSSINQFHIPRDEKAEERLIAKFSEVALALFNSKDAPPSCDYIKGDRSTNYCDYPSDCGVGR